jgi:MYXO-CTERM domain-containing protein
MKRSNVGRGSTVVELRTKRDGVTQVMAKKMLGKVVAGAALGGAGLLVFTPGMAWAGGHPDDEGKVIAKPHVVKAGDEVKLLEVCPESQEHAFVWSKVTGKVQLHSVRDEHGDQQGDWEKDADQGPDGKDRHGRDEEGRGDHGKGKDDHGKGKDDHGKGKDDHGKGKDDHGKGPDGHGDEHGWPQPPADGTGGGVTGPGDQDRGWQSHDQYGQDEESDQGRDRKDHDRDAGSDQGGDWTGHDEHGRDAEPDYGRDGKDRDGHGGDDRSDRDRTGHDEYAPEAGSDYGHGDEGWEHGKDFVYFGEATVSEDARPGTYELRGSCGEGELVVLPRGPVDGGDGGMSTTSSDRGMAAGGAGMIGAAALGGIVLLRRRRADDLV